MTSTPTRPVDNVVIATKGLQDRNTNITAGKTVENKGKLILVCVCSTHVELKFFYLALHWMEFVKTKIRWQGFGLVITY